MTADRALDRLRDPDDPALAELAALVADEVARRPLQELVAGDRLGPHLGEAVRALHASDGLRDRIRDQIEAERGRLRDLDRPVDVWLPPHARDPLLIVVGAPWSPSQDLTFRILNHEAVRRLLREVLSGTLRRFASGVRSLDQGAFGGLAGRVAKRGKSLFGAAEGIVDAVRGEVEQAFEARIKEFLGTAVDEAIRSVAAWLSDPTHAPVMGAMRSSAVQIVLDERTGDLVAEADDLDLDPVIDAVLDGIAAAAEDPGLDAALGAWVDTVTSPWADQTLGDRLEALGSRDAGHEVVTAVATDLLREVVLTEAFEAWWRALHA